MRSAKKAIRVTKKMNEANKISLTYNCERKSLAFHYRFVKGNSADREQFDCLFAEYKFGIEVN